jgi:type IV pilus assembly protein PilV
MTLIEVILSLVILMIVSLALMQSAAVGTFHNMRNVLRDEAVSVAEMRMNQLMSMRFTDLTATGASGEVESPPIERKVRTFSVYYTLTRFITDITTDTKQITITVAWTLRGKQYSHSMTTIKRNQ